MAKNIEEKLEKELINAEDKSSIALMGIDGSLDRESNALRDIIRQTTHKTTMKYGERTDGRNLDFFTDEGLSKAFVDATVNKNNKEEYRKATEDPKAFFKKYMNEKSIADLTGTGMRDMAKMQAFANYEAIYKHIPECSKVLNIFVDSIISPDDFSKSLFTVEYKDTSDEEKNSNIIKNCKFLIEKYKLEEKTEDIIRDTLKCGENYYAVLSLEDEMNMMLDDKMAKTEILTENLKTMDLSVVEHELTPDDISLTEEERAVMNEMFNVRGSINESENKMIVEQKIIDFINDRFIIGSKLELLQERAGLERERLTKWDADISDDYYDNKQNGSNKRKKKKADDKPLFLKGSALRKLDPAKVIDLRIDDISYGYYYIEDADVGLQKDHSQAGDYLSMVGGRTRQNTLSMQSAGTSEITNFEAGTSGEAKALGVSQSKLNIISDVFIKVLSQKIDKEYVRHNKQFKDFIYNIVKQDYILNKQSKFIYFLPTEVVKFEAKPVFENIVFFAKLYLAELTNLMLVNLTRSHDKRVIRVPVGLDADAEQAVSNVVEQIKAKEYRLSDLDINTILQLEPGIMDDWYIPTINGNPGLEFETLAGMDVDISNNGFLDWLRKSMINGMGVPANLVDNMSETDFSRTVASQNGNFVKAIVRYQKRLEPSFSDLVRKLYENEYKYNNDAISELPKMVNIDRIVAKFQPPHSLIMTQLAEQIQTADSTADSLASALVPPATDGSTEDLRQIMKSKILQEYVPGVDWEYFEKYRDTIAAEMLAKRSLKKEIKKTENEDQFGGY